MRKLNVLFAIYKTIREEKNNISILSSYQHKQSQENQTLAWISETRPKPNKKMQENPNTWFS